MPSPTTSKAIAAMAVTALSDREHNMVSADQPLGGADTGGRRPLSERFFSSIVARRGLFLDVGAGTGRFTVLALGANPQIEAVAVEATAGLCDQLRSRLANTKAQGAEVFFGGGGSAHDGSAAEGDAAEGDAAEGDAAEGYISASVFRGLLDRQAGRPAIVRLGSSVDGATLLLGLRSELSSREDLLVWFEADRPATEGSELALAALIEAGWRVYAVDDRRGLFLALEDPKSPATGFAHREMVTFVCIREDRALDVCFFSHASSLNGAERTLLEIVRYGVRQTDLIATVILPSEGPLSDELAEAGAACVVAEYSWWCDSQDLGVEVSRERMLGSAAVVIEELVPLLEDVRPGLIVTSSIVIPWGAVAAAVLRRPHVWYVKEFGELDHGFHFFEPFEDVPGFVRSLSDLVLTVSEAVREELFADLSRAFCRTVHSYIEAPRDERKGSDEFFHREGSFRIGNFHTLSEGKDQATLIRSVAALTQRGHNIEVLLAGGSDDAYREGLEGLIAEHGLGDRVRLGGFLDDPYAAMQSCDAVVLCSRCEAFGRVAVEGALMGRPIVYPAAGGYLESMRDRETGLAYPPGDAAALADRIETLLRDPELARRLGVGARAHACELMARARPDRLLLPFLHEVSRRPVPADRASLPMLRRLTSVRQYLLRQSREAAALRTVQEELRRQIENLLGVSSKLAAMDARVAAVEQPRTGFALQQAARLPGRPDVDDTTVEGAKQLERLVHHLQDSIDRLATDSAQLGRQLADVVTLLELRRDSGLGVAPAREPGSARRSASAAHGLKLFRALKRVLRPGYRMLRAIVGRSSRATLRLLTPRLMPPHVTRDEIRLEAGQPRLVASPILSVVVPVDGLEPDELEELLDRLVAQTVTSVEWVLWSASARTIEVRDREGSPIAREQNVNAATLRERLGGAYATTVSPESKALPLSWLEIAGWSGLAEALPLVRLTCEDATGRRVLCTDASETHTKFPSDLLVVRRDLWALGGLDDGVLARLASGLPRVVGRVIRHTGDFDDHIDDFGPVLPGGADKLVRRCGDHLVTARSSASLFRHTIYPLDEILPEESVEDSRRSVLILVPFLAIGGAEKLTYDLIRRLRERFRFIIATLAPHEPTFGNRLDDFRRLTPHVYTLGESFVQPLLFSVLSHLIRKYQVRTLFNANGTTWFYEALGSLRHRFPEVAIVNQLFDHREGWIEYYTSEVARCCDIHIATNAAIENALRHEHGVPGSKVRHIPHGIDLDEFRPEEYSSARLGALREELGVPRDAILVTMAVRMHPQKRPQDFVALARELAGDESFYFLLVGGGPLERSIQDLARSRVDSNLRVCGFYNSPIADLLAISDIACMMSEYEALPLFILSALAMEKPVVATDVGAIASVLNQGPCGIVVPRVGDLDAFRMAIRSLKEPRHRQALGRAGRVVVEKRFAIATAAREYARVFEAAPTTLG